MIARTHRFHGFNALRHVYSRGLTVRASSVSIKYMLNPKRSSYRVAVVVSRKVHHSAVVRNRIRRRIYELIRSTEVDMTGPYDIVVTVFAEQLASLPADELRGLVLDQLARAGIIRVADPSAHVIVESKEH